MKKEEKKERVRIEKEERVRIEKEERVKNEIRSKEAWKLIFVPGSQQPLTIPFSLPGGMRRKH